MTKWDKYNEERIVIAKFCGWTDIRNIRGDHAPTGVRPSDKTRQYLSNYRYDLNSLHEAEKSLTPEQWVKYELALKVITFKYEQDEALVSWRHFGIVHTSSEQRYEAFLMAIGNRPLKINFL